MRKHLKSKHEYFAEDILVKDAEVFMKKRFVSEDIRARPLPPLEVEVQGGVELKSVVEILDKYLVVAPPLPPLVPPGADFMLGANPSFMNPMAPMGMNPEPMFLGDNGRFSNDNRDFNRGNRRGRDDRDRRNSNNSAGGNTNSGGGWNSRESFPKYVGPKSEDNNQRKLSSYLDVDAPKVSNGSQWKYVNCTPTI